MSHRPSSTQKKRQAQRSITTPPSQPVIGAVGHQADPVILRQTLNDPRHARPEVILALQRTIGNQAIQRLLAPHDGGSRTPNIQRQIRVKERSIYYDSAEALPEHLQGSEDIRTKADHPDTYLVKTVNDLKRRAKGEEAYILSPHRHLIGEDHRYSPFKEIVKDWGWGADKMAEGLQTSQSVECSISKSDIKLKPSIFAGNPYYGAKHLENMHAYTLQELSLLQYGVSRLQDKAIPLSEYFDDGSITDEEKEEFDEWQCFTNERAKHLHGLMEDYRAAAEQSLDTGNPQSDSEVYLHVFGLEMADQWDQLFTDLKQIRSSPWRGYSEEVHNRLQQKVEDTERLKQKLRPIAASVVSMIRAEAPNQEGKVIVDQSWKNASYKPLTSICPIREVFMAENINNNLNKPGIVQIGAQHVDNLQGQILDGKYHRDAGDFYDDLLT